MVVHRHRRECRQMRGQKARMKRNVIESILKGEPNDLGKPSVAGKSVSGLEKLKGEGGRK